MFDVVVDDAAAQAVRGFQAAVDALIGLAPTSLPDADLLTLLRLVEVQTRRLPVADHAVVAEVNARGLAHAHGCPNTATLLRQLLRLTPSEATGRVRAAADLGPRRELTGAPLAPLFPDVAAAQADGAISATHARVITKAIDTLPDVVEKEHGADVQTTLVEHARMFDPKQLTQIARRIADNLDPDGTLTSDADQQRTRDLTLTANSDGTGTLTARLTAACLEVWLTILDSLARPVPAADGDPDRRTPAQRRHDALLDAGQRLLRAGDLPDVGGTPVTVLLQTTPDQATTGTGLAVTGHGHLISVREALTLAADPVIVSVVIDPLTGITGYGRSRRCASPSQRLALAARDRGCSSPAATGHRPAAKPTTSPRGRTVAAPI